MIEIKDLLPRFGNLIFQEEIKKENIRIIISQIIHFDIKKEDIEIKNNIIYLNIKPIYKSEIFLKKEEIFNKLSGALNKKTPTDIQ